MRAYAVKVFCEPVEELDFPDPAPKGTEVVLAVTRCGVCHSDLHLQEGFYELGGGKRMSLADRGVTPPVVLGHEVYGTLVAKGPDAPIADDQIGKSFIAFPWLGCGQCEICLSGQENLCAKPNAVGVHRYGGQAEKLLLPHSRYLVEAEGVDPSLAATYACSGLTAYSALKKVSIDRAKDWLLILGLGGVGLSGLQIARALGFRNIAVADIDDSKRALATRHGAGVVVDPKEPGALEALAQATGGIGAAIDFVGARPTAEFGMAALKKAGTYIIVGLFGGDTQLSLPLLVLRALTLRGSYVGNLAELRELIDLVKAGKVEPLPTETVPMTAVNDALERLRAGKVNGRLVLARG